MIKEHHQKLSCKIYFNSSFIIHLSSLFLFAFFFCGFLIHPTLFSQNLIPDGGFEELIEGDCLSPSQGFNKSRYWYLLDATPDLFEGGCDFNELDFVYWEEATRPFEGRNYAGLWSRWNSNGTFFTEGIATSLREPLEAGKTYFFEMAIRNQGTFQGLDESVSGCALNPEKHIDLYLSEDSIRVINDFANGVASTPATLVATMASIDIQSGGTEDWVKISTCFQAQGGERFFAIILPLGTFGPLPPCAATMASSGVFRSFYYNVDATFLTGLPPGQEREITACDNKSFDVNLLDLFEFPLFENATFVWEDSVEGSSRSLSEPKRYVINAQVGCGSIPLTLNVLPENCLSSIYVPNIFSPNGDGYNDAFLPFIKVDGGLDQYRFRVFDRWGNRVFESQNPDVGWEGTFNGQDAPQGVYLWFMTYEIEGLSEKINKKESGDVMLIR